MNNNKKGLAQTDAQNKSKTIKIYYRLKFLIEVKLTHLNFCIHRL